jgi:hypothetical protein
MLPKRSSCETRPPLFTELNTNIFMPKCTHGLDLTEEISMVTLLAREQFSLEPLVVHICYDRKLFTQHLLCTMPFKIPGSFVSSSSEKFCKGINSRA